MDGSITIDALSPTINVVDDDELTRLLLGTVLDKMGQSFGWTRGEIVSTDVAVYFEVGTDSLALLHQFAVGANSSSGDSGSPVFSFYGQSSGLAYGILWSRQPGYYWFSPLSFARYELGFALAGT